MQLGSLIVEPVLGQCFERPVAIVVVVVQHLMSSCVLINPSGSIPSAVARRVIASETFTNCFNASGPSTLPIVVRKRNNFIFIVTST